MLGRNCFSQNAGRMLTQRPDKHEYNEAVVQRLEGLLTDMGWDYKDLANRMYRKLGLKQPKGVIQYFTAERRSVPTYALAMICDEIGVSPNYVMGFTQDLQSSIDKTGLYAMIAKPRIRTA